MGVGGSGTHYLSNSSFLQTAIYYLLNGHLCKEKNYSNPPVRFEMLKVVLCLVMARSRRKKSYPHSLLSGKEKDHLKDIKFTSSGREPRSSSAVSLS